MIATALLASFLASQAQPARVPPFQPRLHFKFQAPASSRSNPRSAADREIVCGMVVVHKSPDDDPKILLPARETGAVIRRVEPQACGGRQIVRPR